MALKNTKVIKIAPIDLMESASEKFLNTNSIYLISTYFSLAKIKSLISQYGKCVLARIIYVSNRPTRFTVAIFSKRTFEKMRQDNFSAFQMNSKDERNSNYQNFTIQPYRLTSRDFPKPDQNLVFLLRFQMEMIRQNV